MRSRWNRRVPTIVARSGTHKGYCRGIGVEDDGNEKSMDHGDAWQLAHANTLGVETFEISSIIQKSFSMTTIPQPMPQHRSIPI
jgi:hypothetical protein